MPEERFQENKGVTTNVTAPKSSLDNIYDPTHTSNYVLMLPLNNYNNSTATMLLQYGFVSFSHILCHIHGRVIGLYYNSFRQSIKFGLQLIMCTTLMFKFIEVISSF